LYKEDLLCCAAKHNEHNSAPVWWHVYPSSYIIRHHLPSLLCLFFCLCSRLTCCGSAKNFGQHWLCSLQIFYQSVSSDFVPILISSVLVELSICVLEFLLVHSLQRVYWQAWDFPIYGAALDRVVYQDAVEYEEAWWLRQYSIKPWNFEIELTFYLLGLSNFNIHSLVHKHQGRLFRIIAQTEGRRSEKLDSKIPYSQMFLPLVGTITSTIVSAFKWILENVQTHPLKSTTKHFV
jgi:hypothetical protein